MFCLLVKAPPPNLLVVQFTGMLVVIAFPPASAYLLPQFPSTLKMEAIYSIETSGSLWTTRLYNIEDSTVLLLA
jgi:hypothetical protein